MTGRQNKREQTRTELERKQRAVGVSRGITFVVFIIVVVDAAAFARQIGTGTGREILVEDGQQLGDGGSCVWLGFHAQLDDVAQFNGHLRW